MICLFSNIYNVNNLKPKIKEMDKSKRAKLTAIKINSTVTTWRNSSNWDVLGFIMVRSCLYIWISVFETIMKTKSPFRNFRFMSSFLRERCYNQFRKSKKLSRKKTFIFNKRQQTFDVQLTVKTRQCHRLHKCVTLNDVLIPFIYFSVCWLVFELVAFMHILTEKLNF